MKQKISTVEWFLRKLLWH